MRGKLRKAGEPVPSPVVEGEVVRPDEDVAAELVARIRAAESRDAVKAASDEVAQFLGGNEARLQFRPELMAAYAQRVRELDAAAAQADQQEGPEAGQEVDE